jgi:phosphoglycerate kinase
MNYLRDIKNLNGVKVIMCADFNVPVVNGMIIDNFRLRKIIPSILYLRERKAKVILIGHIETPKEHPTMEPVVKYLDNHDITCSFIKDYKDARREIDKMKNGDIVILENIREHPEEKLNDDNFAKELASLADIYVNEAFSVSHRSQVSVSAITKFIPSYAGPLFEREVKNLSTAFKPDHPFIFILGGAKFDTKLPLIEKFLDIADKIFVGGALANNFFKEKGIEIGKSVVSPNNFNLSRFFDNKKLIFPIDGVVSPDKKIIKRIGELNPDDVMYDAGPETVKMLEKEIMQSKHILWNGPLGIYEQGFKESTQALAKIIANSTACGARSILGGGDTLATISDLSMEREFTFVSTGGGAMLDFLAKGTLPGIEALDRVVS